MRTAGHDFMDFRTDNANPGGSDGCINFNDPDNTGISQCLQNFQVDALYKEWKGKVTLADFFVIASEAGMGRAATDNYEYFNE